LWAIINFNLILVQKVAGDTVPVEQYRNSFRKFHDWQGLSEPLAPRVFGRSRLLALGVIAGSGVQ